MDQDEVEVVVVQWSSSVWREKGLWPWVLMAMVVLCWNGFRLCVVIEAVNRDGDGIMKKKKTMKGVMEIGG